MDQKNQQWLGYGLIIVMIIFIIALVYEVVSYVGDKWWFWTFLTCGAASGLAGAYLLSETS